MIEIETKIAYQEKTIKDLNSVICRQQEEIERLGSICNTLVRKMSEISGFGAGNALPANEKPPHY